MPCKKWAYQTLERYSGACDAGNGAYLGSGLLAVQKIAIICSASGVIRGNPGYSPGSVNLNFARRVLQPRMALT